MQSLPILVVEDNKADVYLIREALKAANLNADVHVLQDGEEAVRYFERVDADESLVSPTVVILDINLPRRHGGEVLQQLRRSRRCADALVVVVTSSDSNRDREEMASIGVNAYSRKPSEFDAFLSLGNTIKSLLQY